MSYPFGGHPRFDRLLVWLSQNGCTTEIQFRTSKSGRSYKALVILNDKGKRAILVDPEMNEYMTPSMVSYFQRKLGIKVPFASQPEITPPETPTVG